MKISLSPSFSVYKSEYLITPCSKKNNWWKHKLTQLQMVRHDLREICFPSWVKPWVISWRGEGLRTDSTGLTLAIAFRRCLTSPSCRLWPVSTVFILSTRFWIVSQTVSICCSFSVWIALCVDISWVNCLCADKSHSELPIGCSRLVS